MNSPKLEHLVNRTPGTNSPRSLNSLNKTSNSVQMTPLNREKEDVENRSEFSLQKTSSKRLDSSSWFCDISTYGPRSSARGSFDYKTELFSQEPDIEEKMEQSKQEFAQFALTEDLLQRIDEKSDLLALEMKKLEEEVLATKEISNSLELEIREPTSQNRNQREQKRKMSIEVSGREIAEKQHLEVPGKENSELEKVISQIAEQKNELIERNSKGNSVGEDRNNKDATIREQLAELKKDQQNQTESMEDLGILKEEKEKEKQLRQLCAQTLTEVKEENQNLQIVLTSLSQDKDKIEQERDQTNLINEHLRGDLKKMSLEVEQIKAENSKLVTEMDKLVLEKRNLCSEIEQIAQEKDKLASLSDLLNTEYGFLIQEKAQIIQSKAQLAQENKQLREAISVLKKEIDQKNREFELFKNDSMTLGEKLRRLSEENNQLMYHRDELANECKQLRETIEQITFDKEKLEQEKGIIHTRIKQLERDNCVLSEQNGQWAEENNALKARNEKLFSENSELFQRIIEVNQQCAESSEAVKNLFDNNCKLNQQVQELTKQVDELSQHRSRSETEKDIMKKKINDSDNLISKLKEVRHSILNHFIPFSPDLAQITDDNSGFGTESQLTADSADTRHSPRTFSVDSNEMLGSRQQDLEGTALSIVESEETHPQRNFPSLEEEKFNLESESKRNENENKVEDMIIDKKEMPLKDDNGISGERQLTTQPLWRDAQSDLSYNQPRPKNWYSKLFSVRNSHAEERNVENRSLEDMIRNKKWHLIGKPDPNHLKKLMDLSQFFKK